MWERIPADWKRKQVYTDALNIYDSLIPCRQHWVHASMNGVCPKGSADTNIAEGCNNYLRHRVSYLVRDNPSFARKTEWLYRRLFLVLYNRNQKIKQTILQRQTTAKVT